MATSTTLKSDVLYILFRSISRSSRSSPKEYLAPGTTIHFTQDNMIPGAFITSEQDLVNGDDPCHRIGLLAGGHGQRGEQQPQGRDHRSETVCTPPSHPSIWQPKFKGGLLFNFIFAKISKKQFCKAERHIPYFESCSFSPIHVYEICHFTHISSFLSIYSHMFSVQQRSNPETWCAQRIATEHPSYFEVSSLGR